MIRAPGDGGNSYRGAFGGAGGDGGGFEPGQSPAAARVVQVDRSRKRIFFLKGVSGVNGFGIIFRIQLLNHKQMVKKHTGSEGGDSNLKLSIVNL